MDCINEGLQQGGGNTSDPSKSTESVPINTMEGSLIDLTSTVRTNSESTGDSIGTIIQATNSIFSPRGTSINSNDLAFPLPESATAPGGTIRPNSVTWLESMLTTNPSASFPKFVNNHEDVKLF